MITSVAEQGDEQDRGVVTGKVFEAMGLRTPVLAVAPEGSDLEAILTLTGRGRRFTASAVPEMEEFLVGLMREGGPRSAETPEFDWPSIGARLDDALREALRIGKALSPAEGANPESLVESHA